MDILVLTETIKKTFARTIKLKEDGVIAHRIDKDVLNVIAIAVAWDILEAYKVEKK